jgi:hypothetical protein
VHNDLCIMSDPSLAGEIYVCAFIDEFSMFTWIYLLKIKDIIFGKFNHFKALIGKMWSTYEMFKVWKWRRICVQHI